jgi:hypothetical protein
MNDVIGFSINHWRRHYRNVRWVILLIVISKRADFIQMLMLLMNYGGIRLTQIPRVQLPKKVYELMPFDNIVIVQKVNGKYCNNFSIILQSAGLACFGLKFRKVRRQ